MQSKFEQIFLDEYAKLNQPQKEAVEHTDGPVLVIAGPGTGKTQILAIRIGNILRKTDVYPENILCLTYTDAGTITMRKRLLQFIGPDAYRVNIYTFHAFCNEIIQTNIDYFGKRNLEPISELENVNIIEDILHSLPANHILKKFKGELDTDTGRLNNLFKMMKDEDWSVEKMQIAIDAYLHALPFRDNYIYKRANAAKGIQAGDVKQKDIDAETLRMEKLRAAANLFPVYVQKMHELGRYDYSDMILWVLKAFKEDENLLRTYQERYHYFLIDEFQDTNGAQNEILQQLINYWSVPNVFAVGDDDQSIYEFQGARVKNIMDFYHKYEKEIKIIVLTNNYRSTPHILNAARVIIENNTERLITQIEGLSKILTASLEERKNQTTKPVIYEYKNIAQEEAGILMQVEELQKQNFPLKEVAVIYHRHAQAENLIELFEKRNIPYNVKRKINILDLPQVKNILHILKYVCEESNQPHSAEYELFQMMHFNFFEIHPHDVASISAYLSSKRDEIKWRQAISDISVLKEIKLKNPDAVIRFEKNLIAWIAEVNNLTLQILFEKILNESGLLKYILKQSNRTWQLEIITTLFDFIKTEASKQPGISITAFLETIKQMQIHKIQMPVNKTIVNPNGVNFITAHSAKGSEFEYVYLLGCTSNKWESARGNNFNFKLPDTLTFANEQNTLEALRRLFYVAITRAKQHLIISYAQCSNDGKEQEASQFIAALTNDAGLAAEQKNISDEKLIEYKIASLLQPKPVVIDLFDTDFIHSRLQSFILSASALNTYLDCPIKFYFERIIKIPRAKNDSMAFGSAMHIALKKLFDRMKESPEKKFPPIEIVLQDFIFEMNSNKDSFTSKQFNNRVELGKKLLPEYYANYVNDWNKIVLTEFSLRNVNFENVPITGVFDKIEFKGNEVNVVDYKTGSVKYGTEKLSAPNDANPLGGDYWRQIMFYKILMDNQKQKAWKMVSGEIDFIEKDDAKYQFVKHSFAIVPGELEVVKQQIRESHKKIMNMEFTTGCGKENCEWCEFVRNNYVAVQQ